MNTIMSRHPCSISVPFRRLQTTPNPPAKSRLLCRVGSSFSSLKVILKNFHHLLWCTDINFVRKLLPEIVNELKEGFSSGVTKDIEWRRSQLNALLQMLNENEGAINEALHKDFGRAEMETYVMETNFLRQDIVFQLKGLDSWVKPDKVKRNLLTAMDTAYIQHEPFGVILVIGAWNYPFQLTLMPLAAAIAAGNCVLVKPSELSETSAQLVGKLVHQYLDNKCIRVVQGAVKETTALLQERFDFIFYTGSSAVGKLVMKAAAEHLTPVGLEMGGKSPCIIDENCDLDVVANRVAWGRYVNTGQTCVAPDYVLCTEETQERFIKSMGATLTEFYGPNPKESPDFARVVNERHFNRLKKLMEGSEIAIGGDIEAGNNYISPTVLRNVKLSDPPMQSEIFGPILPIVPVKDIDEALDVINSREKPLSMYVFSNNKATIDRCIRTTSSGSVCVNDAVVQGGLLTLPFGGVGHSGQGAYHGKHGFDLFSHKRAVLKKDLGMERLNSIRYPPYTEKKFQWVRRLVGQTKVGGGFGWVVALIFALLVGIVLKGLSMVKIKN